MEEIKKEEKVVEVEKDYYTKQEVVDIVNKKIADTFSDLMKQINITKPEPKEEPKEKTIEELRF